ncbi:MAG: VWA domain-containing protein [Planctomycetes bacterium]|nr:VWA domain-containing protein [Planctomycetota bacterium]
MTPLLALDLQLEHPEFLWVLAGAVPVLVVASLRSYAIQPRWLRVASFALRVVGLAALTLALCRPVLRHERPDEAVVFALDVSDSVDEPALQAAVEHVAAATRALAEHQRAALLVFGGRPEIVRPLLAEPIAVAGPELVDSVFHRREVAVTKARIQELERDLSADGAGARLDEAKARLAALQAREAALDTRQSSLRDALRLARSVMPEDALRRIVLFSDGNWTRDDPAAELGQLRRAGVRVDVVVATARESKEIVAERLDAPGQVRVREPVELELVVDAAEAADVEIELYRNQFKLTTQPMSLRAGRNVVNIPKQELEEGFHVFEAVVRSKDDPRPENNVARAVVVVQGRPKVLLIEGDEQDARYLEAALQDEDILVEVRPPVGFPEDLNGLLAFDVLMISDVAATDLHSSQLDLVKRYVKDFGGGLVMLGGERSFGLGGYYRTPVEDALPVRMPIQKTIEKPSFAMVLVLDRSGSMAGEKLALAREAAIASAELLKKQDQIGVVCFDEAADWVVELQSAQNRDEIVTQIARISEGGGTYIYAGLYEAYMALTESTAKLKHCIVLSDGHTTGSREEHLDIVHRMAAEQITVSTVGIGDADQALMSAMADAGAGEAYFTNDFGNVPQIFTKETLRASRSMLVEEPFIPAATDAFAADPMMRGIEPADFPLLLGYVSTTPKERARVLLVSDYGDPILATWSYGLGRSVAFTSDARNRWASDWIGWEGFGKFWSQVIRGVMARGTTSALQQEADIRIDRGEVRMTIDSRDRDGRFVDEVEPVVAVVEASGETREMPSEHTAPGLRELRFPLQTFGEYVRLRVESRLNGETVALNRYALIESYPPEYRAAAPDRAFLESVAATTGGRVDAPADRAFAFDGPPARGLEDLWRLLLLVAGLLLPLDIALRRLA